MEVVIALLLLGMIVAGAAFGGWLWFAVAIVASIFFWSIAKGYV